MLILSIRWQDKKILIPIAHVVGLPIRIDEQNVLFNGFDVRQRSYHFVAAILAHFVILEAPKM